MGAFGKGAAIAGLVMALGLAWSCAAAGEGAASAPAADAAGSGQALPLITREELESLRMEYVGDHPSLRPEVAQIGFCVMYAALSADLRKEALQRIQDSTESLYFAAHTDSGANPLTMAAQMGDPELVQALLAHQVPVDGVIAPGADWMPGFQTPLMAAVAGAINTVPDWLPPGVYNPFHPSPRRAYRASFPSAAQRMQVIRLLLKAGANATLNNSLGKSALMQDLDLLAIDDETRKLRNQIAVELINAGANPDGYMLPPPDYPQPPPGQRETLLSSAIRLGMTDAARALLVHGADARAENDLALFTDLDIGDGSLTPLLLAKGANANAYSERLGLQALAVAVWHGRTQAVKSLLDAGANPNACADGKPVPVCQAGPRVGQNATVLMAAVDAGNADIARALLSHGARKRPPVGNLPPPLWQAVLHPKAAHGGACPGGPAHCPSPAAARYDRLAMVRFAVDAGEDPNERWSEHLALDQLDDDDPQLIVYLLDHGARYEGWRPGERPLVGPVTAALFTHRPFLAAELLRRGSGPLGANEAQALHLAAAEKEGKVVRALLLRGFPVDTRGAQGETALHIAADAGDVVTARALLAAGADLNAQMQSALGGNARELLTLGRSERNAMLQPPDWEMTPLMLAAYRGHADMVQLLLKAGADPRLKSEHGDTALTFAQAQHREAAIALLWRGAPGQQPPKPAILLVDQRTGQPLGEAWIIAQKVQQTPTQTTCVEIRAARTDSAGGIPQSWWPEYMGRVQNVYKPGLPVTGSVLHRADGLAYLPMDERVLSDPKADAASARIVQLNWMAGLVSCPGASLEQRKALFPMYKAMIAEAYALASRPAQFSDARKLCDVYYFASTENPMTYFPPYGADPKKAAFLKREAPQCLEPHGAEAGKAAR